jgi:tetratricopeptide (TPR) repeat protein
LIKKVTGIPTPEMTPHLSALRDSELLYERGIFPQATYIFRHSLTQEVAYESLLQKKKQEIHKRIAQAIEELYSDRLEEFYEVLAYHYSKSNKYEIAYEYLRLSGDKAIRSRSNWEAFRFYNQALKVLDNFTDTEQYKRKGIEVRLLMTFPMRNLAYPEDSFQILEQGEQIARELGDEKALAGIYSAIGYYHTFHGDSYLGIEYSEKCLQQALIIEDVELVAMTGFDLCLSYTQAGEYDKVANLAPNILSLLESKEHELGTFGGILQLNPYTAIMANYGHALAWLGDYEKGLQCCDGALRSAKEDGRKTGIAYAELMYGWVFVHRGDGQNAVEHLSNCIKYCEEAEVVIMIGSASSGLGLGYYFLGQFEMAQQYAEKAIKIQNELGIPFYLSLAYWLSGLVNLQYGNLEIAQNWIEQALELTQTNNEKHIEGCMRLYLGAILGRLMESKYEQAEAYLIQGLEILHQLELKSWVPQGYLFLGELYLDMGQKEKALQKFTEAQGMFQEMGMDYWLRRTQEVLERVKEG